MPAGSPVAITIAAGYLQDVRSALVAEIASDSEALRTAQSADRSSSTLILRRDMPLLDRLLNASDDVELTAEHDNISSPLVHMLEALIRLLLERLGTAAQYGPIPMGDVLDVAAELHWAAEEAIRIEPTLATRLTLDEREAA